MRRTQSNTEEHGGRPSADEGGDCRRNARISWCDATSLKFSLARGQRFSSGIDAAIQSQRGDQRTGVCPMSRKTSLIIPRAFCAGALVAILVSFGAQSTMAASGDQKRLGKPSPHRHHFYAMYRGRSFAPPPALPRAPEYGFFARFRRTRSEVCVIHLCRASASSASHATCQRERVPRRSVTEPQSLRRQTRDHRL